MGVCVNRKELPKLGRTGTPPLWDGAWLPPKNKRPTHMCYRVKFGRSATKGVRINGKELQKLAWVKPNVQCTLKVNKIHDLERPISAE